jgi:hypothetical protein
MALTMLDDGSLQFEVHGLRFRQNPMSPELFAFVASSNDLLRFCGVARKSHDLLSNYQRALDEKRVEAEVTPFFRVPENCSPTAIVISLQQTNVCEISFTALDAAPFLDKGITITTLQLRFRDTAAFSRQILLDTAKSFLDSRLLSDQPPRDVDSGADSDGEEDAQICASDEDGASADSADDEDNGNAGSEEDEETVEIGQSILRALRERLDNPDEVSDELIASLHEMLKPALIIDGQHRLYGAAGVEESIPLLVCTMIKPSWKEQVFQFIVVNDKATGIPKPFITSLAGMSLTAPELDELRTRLAQAGVALWEVEVMQRMGYDTTSPFYNLIEFKVTGSGHKGLGYQTMKRVGKTWYSPTSSGLYKLMTALYVAPGDKKQSKKNLKHKWQSSNDWFEFFGLYWWSIRRQFENTPAWSAEANLLTAVVLEMLQADFLKVLDAQSKTFWECRETDPSKIRTEITRRIEDLVRDATNHFKATHFTRQWKRTSLSHKDGRVDLADLFRKIREDESVANHVIFTGRTN